MQCAEDNRHESTAKMISSIWLIVSLKTEIKVQASQHPAHTFLSLASMGAAVDSLVAGGDAKLNRR